MDMLQTAVYVTLGTIAFVVCFVGLWLGIVTLLSFVSGWRRLARTYAATGTIDGERFGFVSGTVGSGSVRYSKALLVTIAPGGIGLAVGPLFSYRSPPLYFGWDAVRDVKRCRGYFGDMVCIRLRDDAATIALAGKVGERVLDASVRRTRTAG